nr:MAG TPA: tail assembly protein [Caudoviricetes sp.]
MDIFINWNNEKNSILLPVNPSSFEIEGAQNNTSIYVHNKGEVNLKGKRGLYIITIESFFPADKYDFINGEYHAPYSYYCKKLKKLFEKNTTVHLIITQTDINMFCTIESFKYGEAERNGDVKYSLAFKEYRETAAKKRITTKTREANYSWKKGDTWSKVVKKCTGTSDGWKKVRNNNKAVIKKAMRKKAKVKEVVALIGYEVVIR